MSIIVLTIKAKSVGAARPGELRKECVARPIHTIMNKDSVSKIFVVSLYAKVKNAFNPSWSSNDILQHNSLNK